MYQESDFGCRERRGNVVERDMKRVRTAGKAYTGSVLIWINSATLVKSELMAIVGEVD